MNMVNFLDGLDGLAAGVCAISGATFAIIELSLGRIGAAVLAAIVCGACLGFLRHNFYPARIFMGDSGALLLGFTLAAISVQGLLKTAALATLLLPLLVLAVPVLDTSFVVAKRLRSGQPIYEADARHLHHRFMRVGFSQRRAVVYLWAWCATLALAALATHFAPPHQRGDWNLDERRRSTSSPGCSRSRSRSTSSTCSSSCGWRARARAAATPPAGPPDRQVPHCYKRVTSAPRPAFLRENRCHKRWYALRRWSPSDRRSPSPAPAACSSDSPRRASSRAR